MSTLEAISKAIKTTLEASIRDAILADPTLANATVKRSYDPRIQNADTAKELNARTVYVIPIGKEFREASDRIKDRNVYRVGIIVADRFSGDLLTEASEVAMTDWVDDAVEWVNNLIYNVLTDVEYEPIAGASLESGDIREVVKLGVLREYGLFWSELDIEFFIDESNT